VVVVSYQSYGDHYMDHHLLRRNPKAGVFLMATSSQEHETALLAETHRYLDDYPVPGVEDLSICLAGRYPATTVHVHFRHDNHDHTLDIEVWAEPEETERGNYDAVYSVVRALIQEEADTCSRT